MKHGRDQKFFHTLLNQANTLADAPGEGQEMVWAECLEIIHQAGDRAARLGLPELVKECDRFKWLATPGEARVILSESLARRYARGDGDAQHREGGGLPRLHGPRTAEGRHPDPAEPGWAARQRPNDRASQQRKRGTILFRREWLDAFIEATHHLPGTPVAAKVRKKSLKPDTAASTRPTSGCHGVSLNSSQ